MQIVLNVNLLCNCAGVLIFLVLCKPLARLSTYRSASCGPVAKITCDTGHMASVTEEKVKQIQTKMNSIVFIF